MSTVGARTKITVLGQTYTTDSDTIADIAQGDYVAIAGDGEGAVSLVYSVGSAYVPGVSLVTVRGSVADVDVARGTARIGAVLVDYSAYLAAAPDYVPQTGDMLEVSGTQPQPGGAILVGTDDRAVVTQLAVDSITTSQGSSGASTQTDGRL